MKELLKERTTTTAAASTTTTIATAATKTSVYISNGRDCVNRHMDVTDGKKGVNAGEPPCRDCCALLAFKYIAACEDVVEFQRKVREVITA